jgi:hypothetical protein
VRLSPLDTAATSGLLYKPQTIDDGDCEEIGGMKIGRGNRSTRRKPAPAPLCAPQIPHGLTSDQTQIAAVESRWLTTWAMVRPCCCCYYYYQRVLLFCVEVVVPLSPVFFPQDERHTRTKQQTEHLALRVFGKYSVEFLLGYRPCDFRGFPQPLNASVVLYLD